MIVVEGAQRFHVASQAFLVEEDREMAWAEKYVIRNPAYKWVLGKFVQADEANGNGHIFALDELAAGAKDSVIYAPLNMLHRPKQIVGAFVANELVYPTGGGPAPAGAELGEQAAMAVGTSPYLEALAVFWRYFFRDEYDMIERAHSTGNLFYSMECLPEQVGCALAGCDRVFDYKGIQHESYCDHLNQPRSRKRMIHPHFLAGALIIPPIRPGWQNADIRELSSALETHAEECEVAYAEAEDMAPHLGPKEWQALMESVVLQAKDAPDLKKIHEQNKSKPHAYSPLGGDGGVSKNAACKKCGKGKDAPIHGGAKDELGDELGRDAVAVAMDVVAPSAEDIAHEVARDVGTMERKKLAKKGSTAYGSSFPVANLNDLNNAIQSYGRAPAEKRSALKSFLMRKAKQLGASDAVIARIKSLGS